MIFSEFYYHFSQRLTDRSKKVLERGSIYAEMDKDNLVTSDHILQAITEEDGSLGCKIMEDFLIKSPYKKVLKSGVVKKSGRSKMYISLELQSALVKAFHTAFKYNQKFVGTEHLLYGIAATCRIPGVPTKRQEDLVVGLEEIIESSFCFGYFEVGKENRDRGWRFA